jgi:hypothetical protein
VRIKGEWGRKGRKANAGSCAMKLKDALLVTLSPKEHPGRPYETSKSESILSRR